MVSVTCSAIWMISDASYPVRFVIAEIAMSLSGKSAMSIEIPGDTGSSAQVSDAVVSQQRSLCPGESKRRAL